MAQIPPRANLVPRCFGDPELALRDDSDEAGSAVAPPDGLSLIRADAGRFTELETQWAAAAEALGEDFGEFATPYISHARDRDWQVRH